ncbi:hypothetical protein [Streptomyces lavendulocolor]|uniref:hypothetical protein n=1 Tax=Streptomyces lavendulocolor TaxID=67316 RepID=UPI0033DAAD6B
MTSHPTPENGSCWWLVSGKWRLLHAIPAALITGDQMRDAIDEGRRIPAHAACGLRRRWDMPGIFSRIARRRCTPCCRALGIPPGNGTPANDAALTQQPPSA